MLVDEWQRHPPVWDHIRRRVDAGAPSGRYLLAGSAIESVVTLSMRVYAQANEASLHHVRTQNGRHEVDLIVERPDQRVVAVEVKLAAAPDSEDVAHLMWLPRQLGDDLLDAAVITTGEHAYRRPDDIAVIPAVLLGP